MRIRILLSFLLYFPSSIVSCYAQSASTKPLEVAANDRPDSASVTTARLSERNPRYKLLPGDVLDVSFELSPELNQQISVQPDGFVTLKQIGDLHVAGESVPELTASIKTAYTRVLNNPIITVTLREFEKPFFTAGGMVGHPGKYELRGDVTLVEALQQAGGLTEESKHSQVLLFHRVSQDWLEAKVVDVKKMLKNRTLAEDVHLQPGDMIFVPQNRISKMRKFIPTAGFSMYRPVM